MRPLSQALAAHLAGRATTLCRCWRLTRRDGATLGFTDHDAAIEFDGTRFSAASGFLAGEAEAMLGLGAGTEGVEGALSSDAIREADIAAGRYDEARIEIFAVNWQDPAQRVLLSLAEIGEVTRDGARFTAELRGLASRLDRVRGRLYRRRCDAALGDARCGVDLGEAGRRIEATVLRTGVAGVVVERPDGAEAADFSGGLAEILDGDALGLRAEIAELTPVSENGWRLATMEPFGLSPSVGDRVRLTAGCDKSFATCRDRFANGVNFRGFPHLPGSDAAFAIAKEDGVHDGAPLVP